jgi:hypothetical protein
MTNQVVYLPLWKALKSGAGVVPRSVVELPSTVGHFCLPPLCLHKIRQRVVSSGLVGFGSKSTITNTTSEYDSQATFFCPELFREKEVAFFGIIYVTP